MSGEDTNRERRYFTTYTGVDLPFHLVNAIAPDALSNRNTFICGYYDRAGKLRAFEKIVYGEVELAHRYEYHANGALSRVEITMSGEDAVIRDFDESGRQVPGQDAV